MPVGGKDRELHSGACSKRPCSKQLQPPSNNQTQSLLALLKSREEEHFLVICLLSFFSPGQHMSAPQDHLYLSEHSIRWWFCDEVSFLCSMEDPESDNARKVTFGNRKGGHDQWPAVSRWACLRPANPRHAFLPVHPGPLPPEPSWNNAVLPPLP